jgi:hypothetical protein
MRLPMWLAVLGVAAVCAAARSETWWIEYDPSAERGVFPEEVGWERYVYGGGAIRFFDPNSALVLDGRASIFISDYYREPIQATPSAGERFELEWSVRYSDLIGVYDPGVAVESSGGGLLLMYTDQGLYSMYEHVYVSDVVDGTHGYRIVSENMLDYTLYVDGANTHIGEFEPPPLASQVEWGDGAQGASSLSVWSYVGMGVTRKPMPGDVNCDGVVDFADINPFIQVLTNQGNGQDNPGCPPENADINGDGTLGFDDINPFIELLTR